MTLTRREAIGLMLAAATPGLAHAHNNPTFKMVGVVEVEVAATADETGAFSPKFDLTLPKGSVQLHYEVAAKDQRQARFSIASEEKVLAEGLAHEGKTKPLRGESLRIVDVTGATAVFTLRIVAEVMVRATG